MPASKRSSKPAEASLGSGVWVVILAGGVGSRFWPVSTPERPKQLLPLASDRPLIADTVERARRLVPDERIRVLAGEHLVGAFRPVLQDLPEACYWVEPRARGTAPVLAWAAWRLARLDPDAVMVSLHADHRIEPVHALRATVATAVEVARRDALLLTVGAVPDRVEAGYGHIRPGAALPPAGAAPAHRVGSFHEKPDEETARRLVDAGCLWNTGIFVWKASVLLEELAAHAPEVAGHLPLLERDEGAFFEAVPASVIDRAVLERSGRVGVVSATFEWDDVGSWEALARTRPGDAGGNVRVGAVRAVDARDNIVFADAGEVVLLGTEGLVVVRTADTTVVLPRDRAVHMKALLAKLEEGAR